MIEKTLIIYILLRIKLRNGKMKIVLAGSVKFTLTKEEKAWGKKAWDIQVIFLELWLLLTSIVLLPISTSFFFFIFLTVYFSPFDESIGFRVFYIYIGTNQLIS